MSMVFKILWIEDDNEYLESLDLDMVRNHIKSNGFKTDFEFRTSEEQINMQIDGMQYDMIVTDYHITNDGPSGVEVIRSIQEKQCFTDVIFYSGKSSSILREEAFKKELDGVFFSSKDSEPLLQKLCQIFDLNIKRLMSIDNIRGLVMSGVADLDKRLLSIISELNKHIEEEGKLVLRKSIINNLAPQYRNVKSYFIAEDSSLKGLFDGISDKFDSLEPNHLNELLSHRTFSSFKRVEAIEKICSIIKVDKKSLIEEIKNLLDWRNALAHQNPIKIENGIKYFEIKKRECPFGDEEARRILFQLRDLDETLNHFFEPVK
ncbi:response regulator [Dickeya undicola]|uniref:Response regulator n=1 Tax=Dickeya undicola TaxID=1577887 RepID=A0A3N0FQN0_9GAMM|nr:response regulator [Dickeya undicola]RNM02382.1 response regulator [Dickeya undicola]